MKKKTLALIAFLTLFMAIPALAAPSFDPPAPWMVPPPPVLEPGWIGEDGSQAGDLSVTNEENIAAGMNQKLYIPLLTARNTGKSSPVSSEAKEAIRLVNEYRAIVGAEALTLNPSIISASENHVRYHMMNHDDPSAWSYGAHGEVDNKPGFTGQWPSDRLDRTGFPWIGGAEVIHYYGDPAASVRDWMNTVFHRILLLDPSAEFAGYAAEKNGSTAIDVMDFGIGPQSDKDRQKQPAPYPLAYPANGQKNVPYSWSGGEAPDPLPAGANRPVGFPFTLQGVGGTLKVDKIELVGPSGKPVSIHPNPPDCSSFNCFAVIAVAPLQPNTTYKVHAKGNVGGNPFDTTWEFRTQP